MSALNSTLRSIIFGEKDFCCLCLCPNQKETVNIDDEITVNLNNNEHIMDICHVLSSVLGEAAYKYIAAFNTFCKLCIKSAINCYRFIQTSRNNVEYLSNILDGIANSFTYTTDEVYNSRSLFVSLNLDDFTSKQVYDTTRKVLTPQAALRRFCSLDVEQINNNELDLQIKKEDMCYKSKEGRHRAINNPLTSNMLFNKNNPNITQCKECLKINPKIFNLRKHYDRVHAPKIFKCSECSNTYGSASNLHAHKTENQTHLTCSECGKTFSCRSTLRMHEVGHHLSIVCQDCGRVYKNKVTFKNHIDLNICGRETRAHPSEAQYTCDYCNKKYTQKVSLRVHIQYDHGNYKGHTCKWCGKKFWAPSRLKAHIVKHTREKNFVCSFCGGKFVSKESLLYHTRRHTGEKPYKCPHCDGRFLSASRRSVHIKSQHQKATYECDVCHRKFHSESYLQKHKQRHFESSYTDKSKNLSENMSTDDLKPDNNVEVQENWNANVASVPTVFETRGVGGNNLKHINIESPKDKVYLEVSDNAEDYIISISQNM